MSQRQLLKDFLSSIVDNLDERYLATAIASLSAPHTRPEAEAQIIRGITQCPNPLFDPARSYFGPGPKKVLKPLDHYFIQFETYQFIKDVVEAVPASKQEAFTDEMGTVDSPTADIFNAMYFEYVTHEYDYHIILEYMPQLLATLD